jgi:hypothetical protein
MTKSTRWGWVVAAVAFVGVALVLLFVLSLTGQGGSFVERHVAWLFWLNLAVAALLSLVILLTALRLAVRKRQGKFGSNLLIKLAGIFALVGVLPGVLIYTVSVQFVSRSIEVWFDARVQSALDAGIDLGRGTLDALVTDLGAKTRVAAERLGETRTLPGPLAFERLREQLSAQEVALVSATGQVLLTASRSGLSIAPERPTPTMLREARNQRVVTQIEGLDEESVANAVARARVKALARLPAAFRAGLRQRGPLPAGGAAHPHRGGQQCAGGAERLQRIPAARSGARRPAAHVHRHADAGADPGGVRRGAAGGGAGHAAGAAAAAAGRGRDAGGRGDLRAKPVSAVARRTRRPDAQPLPR